MIASAGARPTSSHGSWSARPHGPRELPDSRKLTSDRAGPPDSSASRGGERFTLHGLYPRHRCFDEDRRDLRIPPLRPRLWRHPFATVLYVGAFLACGIVIRNDHPVDPGRPRAPRPRRIRRVRACHRPVPERPAVPFPIFPYWVYVIPSENDPEHRRYGHAPSARGSRPPTDHDVCVGGSGPPARAGRRPAGRGKIESIGSASPLLEQRMPPGGDQ